MLLYILGLRNNDVIFCKALGGFIRRVPLPNRVLIPSVTHEKGSRPILVPAGAQLEAFFVPYTVSPSSNFRNFIL